MNKITKSYKNNIKLDYIYTFLNYLNMSGSIWVLYLVYRGMSLLQVGILEGIFHATSMLLEIPSGALADLLGRKKTMLIGRICMLTSCILMLYMRNFWGFALGFMFQAAGNNFNSGSEEALVYDSMKIMNREDGYLKVSGRLNTLIEIAQSVATVVGGILAEYSYTLCYLSCIILTLTSLLPVSLMKEPIIMEDEHKEEQKLSVSRTFINHFKTSVSIMRKEKKIARIILFYSLNFTAYCVLYFYSQQYYSELGLNKIQISIIMFMIGLASCAGAILSEKLYHRFRNGVVFWAIFGISGSIIVFYFKGLILSIVFFMIASFFYSALYPIQSNSLNELIPSSQRATLISVNSMMFSVFMLLFFPIAGAVADRIGLADTFLYTGILLMLISLFSFRKLNAISESGNSNQ